MTSENDTLCVTAASEEQAAELIQICERQGLLYVGRVLAPGPEPIGLEFRSGAQSVGVLARKVCAWMVKNGLLSEDDLDELEDEGDDDLDLASGR